MFKDLIKNFKVSKYVFKFCPFYAFFSLLYILNNIILALSKVYLIKYLVMYVAERREFKEILYLISVYIIILIVTAIIKYIYEVYITRVYSTTFVNKMQNFLFSKVKYVDYADFDNPEFYDSYSRAISDGTSRGIVVYENFVRLISSFASTLALGTFIILSDIWLVLIVLSSVIITLFINIGISKLWHNLDLRTEKFRRMYFYISRVFYQQKYAAELKTTPISDLLIDYYYDTHYKMYHEYIRTQKSILILSMIKNFVTYVLENAGVYVYLGFKLFIGKLGVDTFTSVINSSEQFRRNFLDMASAINKIKENALYIDDFLKFINYKPSLETLGKEELKEKLEELKICDLIFTYPSNRIPTVNDLSLNIKKNEKLAIVGLNGAGKTTLIKLLLKFYNPDSGSIVFNNQNIRFSKEEDIRSKFSTIFQDFQLYAVSIGENILMRRVTKDDEKLVWSCLDKVGLTEKVKKLPMGINTIITREFNRDGVVFSGGERQRIAIARVLASNSDIYILDEPTSALDPLAEKKINDLIMEESPDKTIIIIAHRLSTVVDADRIILIENGKIVESGTHNELMEMKLRYYEMFISQASLYQKNYSN